MAIRRHIHGPAASMIAFALFLGAAAALADPLPDAVTDPDRSARPATPRDAPPDNPAAVPEPNSAQVQSGPQDLPAKAPPADGRPPPPKHLEPVQPTEAIAILGKKVRGPDGKDIVGPVIDVLVDEGGRPRAAIIDFGGFLGVGSRKIAVDWQLLKFRPADRDAPLMLSLDRTEIQAAPEYKDPTQPAEVVEPPAPAPVTPDADKPGH